MAAHLFFGGHVPEHLAASLAALTPDRIVGGVDEAGRGPWVGPVCAAAVILPREGAPEGLNDSKKLTPARRETLFEALQQSAIIGVAMADEKEIARLNILQATYLAMKRAVESLSKKPHALLVDGNRIPQFACPAFPIVKGDGLCPAIAAASIVAKVTRDRLMMDLAKRHPGYGWETNMGYGTPAHAQALARLGPTPHHRRGFKPVDAAFENCLNTAQSRDTQKR